MRSLSIDIDVESLARSASWPELRPQRGLDRSAGGGRARLDFPERWFTTLLADVGGIDGRSNLNWQAVAVLGCQIDDRWSVQGGWRQLSNEKEIEGRDISIDLGGPLLGFTHSLLTDEPVGLGGAS